MPTHKNINHTPVSTDVPAKPKPSRPPADPVKLGGKPMSGTASAPKAGSPMPNPRKFKAGTNYMGS